MTVDQRFADWLIYWRRRLSYHTLGYVDRVWNVSSHGEDQS